MCLPKGFRRARNFGFLHPNCKRLIALLRLLVFKLPGNCWMGACAKGLWVAHPAGPGDSSRHCNDRYTAEPFWVA